MISCWYVNIALLIAATRQEDTLESRNMDINSRGCASYNSCIECVQDPCSRSGKNPDTTRCVFCASSKLCMPLSRASSQCLREDTRIDFCGAETRLSMKQGMTCEINTTSVYVNLNYSATLMWSDPSGTITFGVALCRNAAPTFRRSLCVPQSPIVIYDAPVVGDSQCWNVGNVASTIIRLLNDSDPNQGIEISYGKMHCCPQAGLAYPGNFGLLRVVVTLIPDACDKPYNDAWSVDNIQYPRLPLVNCSASFSDTYNILIRTSRICPQRIFWKVSSTKSELSCSASENAVSCNITPRISFNSSVDFSLCMRFSVRLITTDDVFKVMALKNFTKTREPCSFHINADKTFQTLQVYDVDGTVIGKPFHILRAESDSLNTNAIIGASSAGGFLMLVVVLSVLYCKRQRQGLSSGEKTPLLYTSPGQTQGSVQDLKREPTRKGLQREVKIQRNDEETQ